METETKIDIPFPDSEDLHLQLAVGACKLIVRPGNGPSWVTGTYDDPSRAVPLHIRQDGATVKITQQFTWPETWGTVTNPPTFDLVLGAARPYALSLEGGASESTLDLGELPLTRLTIKHGAGRQVLDFSGPNPEPMGRLSVATGAAALEMANLANANCERMTVEGGAAAYALDFGGALRRDMAVRINTGMSSVEICVPADTAARIVSETVLGALEVGDGFTRQEGAFQTEAALAGGTPILTISANVVMGALRLVTG